VKACVLDEARTAEWNALVAREGSFSLTQSWEWGAFKERLGWNVYRIGVEDDAALIAGAQLLIKPLPLGFSVAYVPRGPVGHWLEDEAASLLFSELERLARTNRAVFLKIEPPVQGEPQVLALLNRYRFRQSRITNQPQTTMMLDISQPPEEILERMRKKTRQYIRRAEREGITTRLGDAKDLPAFCELMRLTGNREGFANRSPQYYQAEWDAFSPSDRCALLLAYYEKQLIAVRTVYYFGRHAAEFHGGSITVPGLHPNYLLVWQAIQWAKERGCMTYDMWGIPDEVEPAVDDQRPEMPERHDGLWGVYQFKRGFGSNVVRYAGAYDLVFMRSVYFLFGAAMVNRTLWERAAARLDLALRSTTSKEVAL